MVTLMMGNIPFIVINDFKMTKDLFTRDEFSGRMKTWWHQNVRGYKGRNLGIPLNKERKTCRKKSVDYFQVSLIPMAKYGLSRGGSLLNSSEISDLDGTVLTP